VKHAVNWYATIIKSNAIRGAVFVPAAFKPALNAAKLWPGARTTQQSIAKGIYFVVSTLFFVLAAESIIQHRKPKHVMPAVKPSV